MNSWIQRNIQTKRNQFKEIEKKELFILDGIVEQAKILKKISSEKKLQISNDNKRSKNK